MHDIVYKKVDATDSVESFKPAQKNGGPVLPVYKKPRWYDNLFSALNTLSGTWQAKVNNTSFTQPSLNVSNHKKPQAARHKIKLQLPPEFTEKTKNRAKKAGESARKGLSTTHGKLLVAHTTALVVLTILVVHLHNISLTPKISIADATPTSSLTRRYLPSIPNTSSQPFTASQSILPRPSLEIYRWVTPWGLNATNDSTTATQYAGQSAFWLTVSGDGTTFTPKADWAVWDGFRQTETGLTENYLTVSGDPNLVSNVLENANMEQIHITNLLDVVKQHNFDGVDIDYEGLGITNRDLFTSFVRTLTAAFHAENKKVAVTLEARIANQVPMDWSSLGGIVDEARIMVYDYHSQLTDTPGPIAPLGWVQEVTSYATQVIPPQKVIIGLGNYGYDWQEPDTPGDSWVGTGISQEKAVALAQTENVPVLRMTGIDTRGYDIGNIPSFTYTDTNGKQHAVWFEDAQSLQDKLDVVAQYPVKGVIFWSVGLGNPSLVTTSGTSGAAQ